MYIFVITAQNKVIRGKNVKSFDEKKMFVLRYLYW